jgi:hypothetical protein
LLAIFKRGLDSLPEGVCRELCNYLETFEVLEKLTAAGYYKRIK